MKKLIIVRHGDFIKGNPFVPDIGCPLSRDGKRQVAEAAARFAGLGIKPDLILISPSRRTGESAEILGRKLGISKKSIRVKKEMFEAEKPEIVRIVHQLDDSLNTAMLVGHDPAMSALLHHLVTTDVYNLKPASYAVLEVASDRWSETVFGKVTLAHLDVPEVKPITYGWKDRLAYWYRENNRKIELLVIFLISLLLVLALTALTIHFVVNHANQTP